MLVFRKICTKRKILGKTYYASSKTDATTSRFQLEQLIHEPRFVLGKFLSFDLYFQDEFLSY